MPEVLSKVEVAREWLEDHGLRTDIQIDGGINLETARRPSREPTCSWPGRPFSGRMIRRRLLPNWKGNTRQMSERVLIADDDPDILAVVQVNFELEGFEVETAVDGEDACRRPLPPPSCDRPRHHDASHGWAHRPPPAGSQASTGNIPIILLTARGSPEDRVRGLELGADDYITKPFDINELVARVRAVVRRTQAARDLSPLTGLPGNFKITGRWRRGSPPVATSPSSTATSTTSRPSTTTTGSCADEVIRFCAKCFNDAADSLGIAGAFVGHIGGDDFVAIIPPEVSESFCKEVIERFDDGILDLYDTADALRGYIEVIDRRGAVRVPCGISVPGCSVNRRA